MRGLAAFLRKELAETLRTWRVWVLPGILLFVGVTSPVLAQLTPQIVGSVASQTPGLVIKLPPPTYVDAYAQWLKNLSQMVLFAAVISMAGMVSAEKRSGTATLVLTKPVSRRAFVLAKAVSGLSLLVFSTLLGALPCWGLTLALFGTAPLAPFAAATGLWLTFAGLIVCVMSLLSTLIDGWAGAAGAGLGFYALLSIAAIWPPLVRLGPVGLPVLAAEALAGKPVEALWPVASAVVLGAAVVAAAASAFTRREL